MSKTYKHIKVDYSGLEQAKKEIFNKAVHNKTKALIEYAKNTLYKAYEDSTFTDQTYNLSDSYLWAVYSNGRIVSHGFLNPSAKASEPQFEQGEMINGRQDAESFLAYYIPRNAKGWEVVFAVTAIYGSYLEGGERGNPQRKFIVISSIFDDVERDFGAQNTKIMKNIYSY